jgi:hypothetical protein
MLHSFSAQSFRCFKDLRIEPLERINLIAGKNNVGKTSLLEAIFLHLGPPSHSRQLFDFLRTLERFSIRDQEYWEWLFRNRQLDATIKLSSVADGGRSRELLVRLVEPETFTLPRGEAGTGTADFGGRFELHMDYRETHADGETKESFVVSASGTATRIKSDTKVPLPSMPWAYLGASVLQSPEDAERFGQLE